MQRFQVIIAVGLNRTSQLKALYYTYNKLKQLCKKKFFFKKKRLPGVGSEPGSSQFHLFSHFHHFTSEPQRLPTL
jgi:hypothetical protein